jgi:outer membrane lipoprotein LolB
MLRLASLSLVLAIVGCATTQRPGGANALGEPITHWQGRMAVKVLSSPQKAFTANFELDGAAQQGNLLLSSPLGISLARLQWAPGLATLTTVGEHRRFDSLDALAFATLGIDIPIASLFDWLKGKNPVTPSWSADLTELADGKLSAVRMAPDLAAELKISLSKD